MFTTKEKEQIIQRYNKGESCASLSVSLEVCEETIRKLLREAGAPYHRRFLSPEERQHVCNQYIAGETSGMIAKTFGTSDSTILNILQENNIPRRDPSKARMVYPIWHEAFSNITPEAAYWIGFLMADGCIHDESKVTLGLAIVDWEHVAKFRSFLKTEIRPIRNVPETKSCLLKIHSRQIVSDLAHYGVVPRKSLIAEAANNIDDHPAFWLGVMDGDGTIDTKKTTVGLFGTKQLMIQFVEFLMRHNVRGYCQNVTPSVHKVRKTGTLYKVCIRGLRARNFLKLAYASSPVWLNRKKEKANILLDIVDKHIGDKDAQPRYLRQATQT